jgi:hypothetical protein
MTTPLLERVLKVGRYFEQRLKETGQIIPDAATGYDWYNHLYSSATYRRAHVEIVDKMQSHKILVLHCTIFPHYNDPSPIWGFDAVCGPNKITGAFHDMSNGGDPGHFMIEHFAHTVKDLNWKKERQLPPWAQEIFSEHIVAAGNINDQQELEKLCSLAESNLDYYLSNVGKTANADHDFYEIQRKYNANNKQNPHVARSMISMGVPEPTIMKFIDEVLYSENR